MKITGIVALMFGLILAGCTNSMYIPLEEDGPAFSIITQVSDDDYVVKPPLHHWRDELFEPKVCAGQNKDPMHLLDPEASCNNFLVEGRGAGNTLFGLGLALASGNFSSYSGDLALMAADEITISPITGEVPSYLVNLSDQQKQVAKRHQAFKTPSDDFNEEHPEALGAWYMAYVAHRTKYPWQSTYLFGYLPLDYGKSPEDVIKRLETEIYAAAKTLLEQRGFTLDPAYVANPIVHDSRHGFRGVFGQQCPELDEAKFSNKPLEWEQYAANTFRTPCLLLMSVGYGGDQRIHQTGGYRNYQLSKHDPQELVQKIQLPDSGLPSQLNSLAGKTVWKIAPEYAFDDLKIGLFFPLGMQIDNESFYSDLSTVIPESLFIHVAHSPGVPVWTGEKMTVRGVPYLLHDGEEIAYVKKELLLTRSKDQRNE